MDVSKNGKWNIPLKKFSRLRVIITCNKHFILSPGVIIAVVNTPANIPALKNCK